MINKIFNCISIHNGGGIIYLLMMHSKLDKKGNLIFLDERARHLIKPFLHAKIKFYKKNLFRNFYILRERIICYLEFKNYLKNSKKKEFIQEFYLNGIPPLFRFPVKSNRVFVLFQNKNLFSIFNFFSRKLFFQLNFFTYHFLHSFLINLFLKKTDTIIVQTSSMKNIISTAKPNNKILISDRFWKNIDLPFFKESILGKDNNLDLNLLEKIRLMSNDNRLFFYPASFYPHKNHKVLFKSFRKLSINSVNNVKLLVTVDPSIVPIEYRQNDKIIFIGNQSIDTVHKIYIFSDFLIFPSINESLGLPLIEASLYNLKIIASDLDYVYEVCNPMYTFNPYSEEDIYQKILKAIKSTI